MTQSLIAAAAALCREFAETYDPKGAEDEDFMDAWRDAFDLYTTVRNGCPPCEPDDPGPPPPP